MPDEASLAASGRADAANGRDDAVQAAHLLSDKIDDLGEKVDTLAAVMRRRVARLSIVLAVVALLAVGNAWTIRYTTGQASCIRAYATASADRTSYLVPLNDSKNRALDAFVEALATKDQSQIQATYVQLLKATQAYESAETTHPPVQSPKFTC
jgi:hypothetical protein